MKDLTVYVTCGLMRFTGWCGGFRWRWMARLSVRILLPVTNVSHACLVYFVRPKGA